VRADRNKSVTLVCFLRNHFSDNCRSLQIPRRYDALPARSCFWIDAMSSNLAVSKTEMAL
jgi:hypothetical protein